MIRIRCNQWKSCFPTELKVIEKRKSCCVEYGNARSSVIGSSICRHCLCANGLVVVLASILFLVSKSEPISAAWLTARQSTCANTALKRSNRCIIDYRCLDGLRPSPFSRNGEQQLYAILEPQKIPDWDNDNENNFIRPKRKTKELQFDDDMGNCEDLDSLRAQAAKLRQEAESLQSAIQESKEAKLRREIDKIDGWIDDLLIEVTLGDGTELLKTVDQVYDVLMKERYSAHHVLKIFERLCDLREQESRSNCSPLMELLVDATGKLDCTEREDCANKRWNHKVERVLRKKLFARDWNIEYISEDEKFW